MAYNSCPKGRLLAEPFIISVSSVACPISAQANERRVSYTFVYAIFTIIVSSDGTATVNVENISL